MSESASNSEKEVVSKYFAEGKAGMDDSTEDFKEPKHSCRGPKSATVTQKPSKTTTKKRTKKIKGQKDIRTVLKKNELVEYAKSFDNVCRRSGLDVDPEQLQIAIALSKSLQSQSGEGSSRQLVELSSQEQVRKIRTTLQEYGFKVPEVKINKKRTLKGYKKNSKLLTITDAERQQNITDRYSQIVFENVSHTKLSDSSLKESCEIAESVPLYHFATNISYNSIKNDIVFYVDKLLEISPNSIGSLLRDWSQIPGRPLSPVSRRPAGVRFSDVTLEMEEIDLVLSGSLEIAQEIVNKKTITITDENYTLNKDVLNVSEKVIKVDDDDDDHLFKPKQPVRCASPDLFDDELSSIIENTKENNAILSQKSSQSDFTSQTSAHDNVTRKRSNDFMDLTECVNVLSQPSTLRVENTIEVIKDSINFKATDLTSRNSDTMEITACASESKHNNDNIDLTQNSDCEGDDTIVVVDLDETANNCTKADTVDLTQSSNSNDETLPFVEISGKSKDNSLSKIVIDNDNHGSFLENNQSVIHSNVDEKLKSKGSSSFEEYIFAHSPESCSANIEINNELQEVRNDIDLTQDSGTSEEIAPCKSINIAIDDDSLGKKDDVSIDYDEIYRDESRTEELFHDSIKDNSTKIITSQQYSDKTDELHNISNDVGGKKKDETERSDPTSEVFEISDEELNYSIHKSKHFEDNSQENSFNDIYFENPIENFEFGGISILDDLSTNLQVSNQNNDTNTESIQVISKDNESFLPDVEIKGTKVKTKTAADVLQLTPIKELVKDNFAAIETPNNRDYIIKTNQVTPMLDYESMSTPDRNKELGKYGLKSFKRKRAIQLLTHLYNQTHPLVEHCNVVPPSPSKRKKPNSSETSPRKSCSILTEVVDPKGKSPRKNVTKSPRKNVTKSPRKNLSMSPKKVIASTSSEDVNKENNVYNEITDVPVLKEIHCDAEDWVFQKREKAKVQSCRVPLHISFHNYANSRRELREAILRYEPVNIDSIHKDLVQYGHRYHPKDLLKFLDKKCITVKTTDNSSRNIKKS